MTPKQQLDRFLDRHTPEVAAAARQAIRKVRTFTPGALEMVYDNYNFLVVGFVPNDRPSDAVFSVVLTPRNVVLCLLLGAGLPDPTKRLRGSGRVVRNIKLESSTTLEEPDVRALIDLALRRARVPFDHGRKRRLIIKSISANQRPRRPAAKKKAAARRKP